MWINVIHFSGIFILLALFLSIHFRHILFSFLWYLVCPSILQALPLILNCCFSKCCHANWVNFHDFTWVYLILPEFTSLVLSWPDLTWLDLTWLILTWHKLTWLDLTWPDLTWLDLLDLGLGSLEEEDIFWDFGKGANRQTHKHRIAPI